MRAHDTQNVLHLMWWLHVCMVSKVDAKQWAVDHGEQRGIGRRH